jgi:hypothetical protein
MKFKLILIFILIINAIIFANSFSITGRTINSGNLNISIEDSIKIFIYSPLNTTYFFDKGDRYLINLNVTSEQNIVEWKYSLYDLRKEIYNVTDISFTPNTTIEAIRWNNRLTVYGKREDDRWLSKNVNFFVQVPNSAPIIGPIDDEILICEGQSLQYNFNATDIDEDNLNSDINPKNPFFTTFLNKPNLYTSNFRIISGGLSKNHVGKNSYTIVVGDNHNSTCCSDSKTTNIDVIEINNPPVLNGIGAQTVWTRGEYSNFYHQYIATDIEDGNTSDGRLRFNISFANNEDLFSINNTNGIINYTPQSEQLGVYSIRVCALDSGISSSHPNISLCLPRGEWAESACDDFTITITDENRPPQIIEYYPSENFSTEGTNSTSFYAKVYDPDGTIPDIDWYVNNILVEHNEELTESNFSYTFGCDVRGNHTIKVVTTDGLLNDTVEWNISVTLVACPPKKEPGASGGGGISFCTENWACIDWDVCQSVKITHQVGLIPLEDYHNSIEICAQERLDENQCGFQIRQCFDLNNCTNKVPIKEKPIEYQICHYTENPSCFDGIKNCHSGGCELLIDCGGPCPPCPTCSDGIKNQGEHGIDCGGPCPNPCPPEIPFEFNWLLILLVLIFVIIVIFIILKIKNISKYKNPIKDDEKKFDFLKRRK